MSILMSILSAAVIFGSGAVLLWQMLGTAGIKLPYTLPDKRRAISSAYEPKTRECVTIFICSMLFRAFVIAAAFAGYCIFKAESGSFNFGDIAGRWLQWDANNYIRISEGYRSFNIDGDYSTIVFFPLYSWLLRAVRLVIHDAVTAGLTLSALLTSFACVYGYKLLCMDYSRQTAQRAVIFMCIFPFSFFNGSVMSESAFLLMSIMVLYFTRKHDWMLAGLFGLLAALSRSAGVFLIFPATVEFVEEYKLFGGGAKDAFQRILKSWTWLLLIPLGTVLYLVINYSISGDPLYFLKMEEKYWYQVSQPFFKTAATFANIVFKGGQSPSVKMSAFFPGFVSLICSYALLVFGLLRHRRMYMVWLLVYIVLNTTMSWPLSFCRYISCAFPLYIILSDMCDNNNKLELAVMMSWGIMFGIYLTGYVTTHQIM